MKHSKGKWKIGKGGGTVVTDDGTGFEKAMRHDSKEYYGGYLIAESILKKADAKLIAQAPTLLKTLKLCLKYCKTFPIGIDQDPIEKERTKMIDVIKKVIKLTKTQKP